MPWHLLPSAPIIPSLITNWGKPERKIRRRTTSKSSSTVSTEVFRSRQRLQRTDWYRTSVHEFKEKKKSSNKPYVRDDDLIQWNDSRLVSSRRAFKVIRFSHSSCATQLFSLSRFLNWSHCFSPPAIWWASPGPPLVHRTRPVFVCMSSARRLSNLALEREAFHLSVVLSTPLACRRHEIVNLFEATKISSEISRTQTIGEQFIDMNCERNVWSF